MIEREIKKLLSAEEYERLIQHERFAPATAKKQLQLNYYYDTKDFALHRQGITLRVRQKNGALSLELKYPLEESDNFKVKQEISKPVSDLPLVLDVGREFQGFGFKDRAFLVQPLITERTSVRVNDRILLDLDRSHYLGLTDHELEVEFAEDSYDEAYSLFQELLPGASGGGGKGKNSRFFSRYLALQTSSDTVRLTEPTEPTNTPAT